MRLTLQSRDPDQRVGQRAYLEWLEARAANDGGKIDEEAMKALATLRISSKRKDLEGMRKGDRGESLGRRLVEKKNGGGEQLDCGTIEHGAP